MHQPTDEPGRPPLTLVDTSEAMECCGPEREVTPLDRWAEAVAEIRRSPVLPKRDPN